MVLLLNKSSPDNINERRLGVIANEITLKKRPKDTEIYKKGHRTDIKSKQSPYRIASYMKNNGIMYVQTMNEKQIYNTATIDIH